MPRGRKKTKVVSVAFAWHGFDTLEAALADAFKMKGLRLKGKFKIGRLTNGRYDWYMPMQEFPHGGNYVETWKFNQTENKWELQID